MTPREHYDKRKFLNGTKRGTKREDVGMAIENIGRAEAFQADDEGSIPFTRSNLFNDLAHVMHGVDTCWTD
jgi:hypothetical protein